jgi:hypothetical protein
MKNAEELSDIECEERGLERRTIAVAACIESAHEP